VALVRIEVSEERIASIIMVKRRELGNLMMEEIRSSEMSVLTRATRRHSPEYGILVNIVCIKYGVLYRDM
jgi:hypothetical protein